MTWKCITHHKLIRVFYEPAFLWFINPHSPGLFHLIGSVTGHQDSCLFSKYSYDWTISVKCTTEIWKSSQYPNTKMHSKAVSWWGCINSSFFFSVVTPCCKIVLSNYFAAGSFSRCVLQLLRWNICLSNPSTAVIDFNKRRNQILYISLNTKRSICDI